MDRKVIEQVLRQERLHAVKIEKVRKSYEVVLWDVLSQSELVRLSLALNCKVTIQEHKIILEDSL